jgi:hypothetical protein
MRIDFTLTLPGLFEIANITRLAEELDVDILAKVIFSFSPDIILSPLALPRELLDHVLDEVTPVATGALRDVLQQLRTRPTFAEQWPDTYQAGLRKGKARVLQLETIRSAPTTMTQILAQRPAVARWWHDL